MSEPQMTKAQARATEPGLNAFVGASAGTGKTHVLTARVLRLLLTGTRPDHLLCLTFTKAAAAEMLDRIFSELGRWTLMEDAALRTEITRRTKEQPDADMVALARRLFVDVLDVEGGLKIQTFHSFCQSLLGRFPLEAGLAPGFEAVEEAEARDVMLNARDRILTEASSPAGAALRSAVENVAKRSSEGTYQELVDRLNFYLNDLAAALGHYGGEMGLFAALERALGLIPGETQDDIHAAMVAGPHMDSEGLRALMEALLNGSKSEVAHGETLSAFFAAGDNEQKQEQRHAYLSVFLTKQDGPRGRIAVKKTLEAEPHLEDVIREEQARLLALRQREIALDAARATRSLLALGIAQLDAYKKLKSTRGLVDFDDMIAGASQLLAKAEISPWVLFKLDGGIDHILVDEAQDTNQAQWQVIEALSEDFFAGESARDEGRTVFAVGDVKQSIYSFQKANPREFLAAEKRLYSRAAASGQAAEPVALDLSFRSGRAVLGLVDAVFRAGAPALQGVDDTGEGIHHGTVKTKTRSRVELWPIFEDQSDEDDGEDWTPPITRRTEESGVERCARFVAKRVADLLAEPPCPVLGRQYRAGDIMILVQSRGPLVDQMSAAMKARGIAVAGKDRMVLTDTLPVKDLMVLGEVVINPLDDLALASLMRSPLLGLTDEQLFHIAYKRPASLYEAFDAAFQKTVDTDPLHSAFQRLRNWMARADQETVHAFYASVLDGDGMRQVMTARLGAEIHDPIDNFLEEALTFTRAKPSSLRAFLTHMTRTARALKRDFDLSKDEVRIMTAHAAKGLQAPIVILPDTVSIPDTGRDGRILPVPQDRGTPPLLLWTSPAGNLPLVTRLKDRLKATKMEEYHRLLYVALTRAEDRLIITGARGSRDVKQESWYGLITDAFEALDAVATEGACQVHEFGALGLTEGSDTVPGASMPPERYNEPQWLRAAAPTDPDPGKPLRPSRIEGEDPAAPSPLKAATVDTYRRGRVLHTLFETLPTLPVERHRDVAQQIVDQHAGDMSPALRNDMIKTVLDVLTDDRFSRLFSPSARAEVPLAGQVVFGGRIKTLSARVDRLLVEDNRVQLVDIKTNRPPPETVEGVDPRAVVQTALYRAALKALFPQRQVDAALLYSESAALWPLDGRWLDRVVEAGDYVKPGPSVAENAFTPS